MPVWRFAPILLVALSVTLVMCTVAPGMNLLGNTPPPHPGITVRPQLDGELLRGGRLYVVALDSSQVLVGDMAGVSAHIPGEGTLRERYATFLNRSSLEAATRLTRFEEVAIGPPPGGVSMEDLEPGLILDVGGSGADYVLYFGSLSMARNVVSNPTYRPGTTTSTPGGDITMPGVFGESRRTVLVHSGDFILWDNREGFALAWGEVSRGANLSNINRNAAGYRNAFREFMEELYFSTPYGNGYEARWRALHADSLREVEQRRAMGY